MSETPKNIINWFEISVFDMPRAKHFYELIFGIQMPTQDMEGMQIAFFPADDGKVSGSLVKSSLHRPCIDGSVLYLNGNPDLSNVLDKVNAAGGKVVLPKTHISSELGYMAFFLDSEGNRIGIHSKH